jgi:hypothetical protein
VGAAALAAAAADADAAADASAEADAAAVKVASGDASGPDRWHAVARRATERSR